MTRRATAAAAGLAGVAAALLACAGSGEAPQPPRRAPAADDAAVQTVLARSCSGCHAEAVALPWPAKLAPSAWFAGAAREKLDLSALPALAGEPRRAALASIERVVAGGEMPPWDSALLDPSEKLTPAEREQVVAWARRAADDAAR